MDFTNQIITTTSKCFQSDRNTLLKTALLLFSIFCTATLLAQVTPTPDPEITSIINNTEVINSGTTFWEIIIGLIVVSTASCVAYLCYLAIQVWPGHWKSFAFAPLAVLGAWLALIVISKIVDATSHSLWAFEIFSWAMMALIYLVILMTAKRTFDKKAQNNADSG